MALHPGRGGNAHEANGFSRIYVADEVVRHHRRSYGFGGDGVEFAAAVIAGTQPKDQLMALQAAQMAVIHCASMKYMRKVADWREFRERRSATRGEYGH